MITDTAWRSVSRYCRRASATSSASENVEKMRSRTSGVGPVLKKGGGWCSITRSRLAPHWSLVVRKDRRESFHFLERFTRSAHHTRERIVCDHHWQTGFFHQ